MMIKKTLKYLYIFLISISVILAGSVVVFNMDPAGFAQKKYQDFTNPKIKSLNFAQSNWVDNSKTLITPNDGMYTLLDVKKDEGTFFLASQGDQQVLMIKMHFVNSSQTPIRPHDNYAKYVSAFQDGRQLSEGMIKLKSEASDLRDAANNAVKFYQSNEEADVVFIFNFNQGGGPIQLHIGTYQQEV